MRCLEPVCRCWKASSARTAERCGKTRKRVIFVVVCRFQRMYAPDGNAGAYWIRPDGTDTGVPELHSAQLDNNVACVMQRLNESGAPNRRHQPRPRETFAAAMTQRSRDGRRAEPRSSTPPDVSAPGWRKVEAAVEGWSRRWWVGVEAVEVMNGPSPLL